MLSHKKLNLSLFICLCVNLTISHGMESGQSFQGLTGLINVPNAEIAHHGEVQIHYSDQIFHQREYSHNNNLMTSIGILPNLEVGGRIAWFKTQSNCYSDGCRLRDLSANIKYQLPFIPKDWLSIAFGQHDLGGAASHFETRFVSTSKTFNNIRLTLGWGQSLSSGNKERLEGIFSGLEYQPAPWINLMLEDDGQSRSVGTRLSTPSHYLPLGARANVQFVLQRQGPINENKRFFSIGLRLPLGKKHIQHDYKYNNNNSPYETPSTSTELDKKKHVQIKSELKSHPALQGHTKHTEYLYKLFKTLKNAGLEGVKIGTHPITTNNLNNQEIALIISLENTTFDHNDLDAINFVIQKIKSNAERPFTDISIVLKNENLAVQKFHFLLPEQSLKNSGPTRIYSSYDTTISPRTSWLYSDKTLSRYKPRITLSPALSNGIATEFGVFDYSLALEANTTISLWKGARINMAYTQALSQSDDFLKGKVFYDARQLSAFKNYGIQQAFKLNERFYNNLFLGLSHYDYYTVNNESTYLTALGKHKFTLNTGHYKSKYETNVSKHSLLASYRYYLPEQAISTTLTAGKFWDEDQGFRLDFKFWFEDKAVTLFYKNTDNQFIGMGLSIPLTPEKAFDKPWGQLKGKKQWQYALQTQIANTTNNVSFKSAGIPKPTDSIENIYFNHDRLSPLYTRHNQHRLRRE